jgi:hypothetical protein
MGKSPAAYRTVRKILSLAYKRCLQENFMNFQLRIPQALTDTDNINLLIEIWHEANGITEAVNSILAILSVDAVAFRPTITIDESGKWRALIEFIN